MKQDLNALHNLFLLYRERSVTRAALCAGVSQPAMSRSLQKLREQYQDRLFLRHKDMLVATPKAEALVARLAPLFDQIDQTLDDLQGVLPAEADGRFCFCAPDFISQYAMANLPSGVLSAAPKVHFYYQYWHAHVSEECQQGDIDLAFGSLKQWPNQVKQQSLGVDQRGFFVRHQHPLAAVESDVSWSQLCDYPHIVLEHSGLDAPDIDRLFQQQQLQRHALVTTPDISAAVALMHSSDCILLAPMAIVQHLTQQSASQSEQQAAARMLCPTGWQDYPQNQIEYALYWGAIKDQDPLHAYIRQRIAQGFQRLLSAQLPVTESLVDAASEHTQSV